MSRVVITISEEYGAGGAHVGPAVAEILGLPYLGRSVTEEIASRLSVPVDEVLVRDEICLSPLLLAAASLTMTADLTTSSGGALSGEGIRAMAERVIMDRLQARGGVIPGRGAAIWLDRSLGGLHVRIRAVREIRIERVMSASGLSRRCAARMVDSADRNCDRFVKRFYRRRVSDPDLYDLIIDATCVSIPDCVNRIVTSTIQRGSH